MTRTKSAWFCAVTAYWPPRPRRAGDAVGTLAEAPVEAPVETLDAAALSPVLRWMDRILSR